MKLKCEIERVAAPGSSANTAPCELAVERLVIAGWAGRDRDDVEHHIRELEAIGVRRPASVPCFYPLAAALLTTGARIETVGAQSSGEVEVVLVQTASDGLVVGIGSDHTDRHVEAYDVTVSKQVCAKPLGRTLWRYDDVAGHWDALVARSWRIDADGTRALYQEGTLARLLPPAELIARGFGGAVMPAGTALFCGTQPVLGALTPAAAYELELHDPVLARSLRHRYAVDALAHEA
ncbi:DUF2848 domain-containing protein [Paraburkholderia caballeronis]|uniref:DUF2848 domain-containing protein n=1 Tax=Paraburkholderia caballeronis TaxID=416943 RepID=A0A1H7FFV1_9BURK|nr:DUF2848 domain-containing protein [Paraburkholderia caballeronis]PXW24998.1 uncharacterized protein DUF2848 [Paraburkholderia caballeronis]PXX00728.1 uncharacterized protein DUF2848 [Paraburkholderia caballeronis]RAJ98791.1 uncharacterized protein DUF2848 [Paraburkholderia caballeronis]SEE72717.1 Protein of unknown function [Paraburkholderia caballeronis]SEK24956.1 Protein of unknown function [Paraburkholderia caballeronis]